MGTGGGPTPQVENYCYDCAQFSFHTQTFLVNLFLSLCFSKSPDPSLPADPEPDAAGFTAETREEPEDRDQTESSPSSPAISEVSETTQLPINGMLAA